MSSVVIFDRPGPKGRATIAWVTAASVVVIGFALAMAVRQYWINGQFAAFRWQPFGHPAIWRFLLKGLGATLTAAAAAAAIAIPLGIVLAVGRLSPVLPLRWLAIVVIEFFRAVPLLLIVYLFFFALPRYGLNPSMFWKLVIPIGLCDGAVLAEVFRAGVLAVPKGQSEAGATVGLTNGQTFSSIVFPQAVRMVVPSLVAQIVILLKDTTLAYAISYADLQYSAQVLTSLYPTSLVQTFFIVALTYIAINMAISAGARALDQRWAAGAMGRSRSSTRNADALEGQMA